MKTTRQLDADRVQAISRTAALYGSLYRALLATLALALTLCAAAQLAVL